MKKTVKILIILVVFVIISAIMITVILKNKETIVCIDAGHGGNDVGAYLDKRYEKEDTLKIAKLIKQYLEEQDIKVILTRDSDEAVSLGKRCKIANKKLADVFVSIHRNSSEDAQANLCESNSKWNFRKIRGRGIR